MRSVITLGSPLILLIHLTIASDVFPLQCSDLKSCAECTAGSKFAAIPCSWCPSTRSCTSLLNKCNSVDEAIRDMGNCEDAPMPRLYDESLARNKMLPLSSAAYSDNPQSCLTNALSGAQLRRQITLQCDPIKADLCSGYTAVSPADRAIIIAFRGSQGFLQIVLEADQSVFGHQVPFVGGGNVSKYFNDAFQLLWDAGMRQDFLTLKSQNPTYNLWVTGHSLGGAMASIAAGTIVSTGLFSSLKTKLITFGQPRTGNHEYSAAIDRLLGVNVYRITHADDLVPHIPPKDLDGYYHHSYEIWYNNDMSEGQGHIQCGDEGILCSDLIIIALNINSHQHYFTHMVSDYGRAGCVGNTKGFANMKNNLLN